jgi:hypothetical protein
LGSQLCITLLNSFNFTKSMHANEPHIDLNFWIVSSSAGGGSGGGGGREGGGGGGGRGGGDGGGAC